jgi:hypothetical protein
MKKSLCVTLVLLAALTVSACAPVQLQKCYTDYKYDEKGKLIQEYKECVTQVPESIPAINPVHKDLYK